CARAFREKVGIRNSHRSPTVIQACHWAGGQRGGGSLIRKTCAEVYVARAIEAGNGYEEVAEFLGVSVSSVSRFVSHRTDGRRESDAGGADGLACRRVARNE